MNNQQASDRLMKLYQSEGEKIKTRTDDLELMDALDCAFGAFQNIDEIKEYCELMLSMSTLNERDEGIDILSRKILKILERYEDDI